VSESVLLGIPAPVVEREWVTPFSLVTARARGRAYMKLEFSAVLVAVMATLGWRANAQTYETNNTVTQIKPTQFKTTLETNWVRPGPYLRVVNGTTYNIAYSKLWGDISKHEGLGVSMLDIDDTGAASHLCGAVRSINGTTVLYDILREHDAHEKWTGELYKTDQEYVKSVVILNCAYPEKLVTGEGAKFFCMKTTNYVNDSGVSFTAYDCGTQATNLVPVIKTVKTNLNP
jgi:hypothetical protein